MDTRGAFAREPAGRDRRAYRAAAPRAGRAMLPSRCVPRLPRKICRTPPSPVSRRPSSTFTASTTCCPAIRHVFASLYNDRAISYRVHKGFVHSVVALSAGVQRMVRSDKGASGVMFTLDTESGLRQSGIHHFRLRAGRNRGAGAGQPRRVLRLQAGARGGAPGDPAPQSRHEGAADGVHRSARGRALGADARGAGVRTAAAFRSATPRSRNWPATR